MGSLDGANVATVSYFDLTGYVCYVAMVSCLNLRATYVLYDTYGIVASEEF